MTIQYRTLVGVKQSLRTRGTVPATSRLRVKPIVAGVCAGLVLSSAGHSQEDSIEEIVITGSRIVRRDLEAPSPLITVDSEAFERSSNVALETTLNYYPQFSPDDTQFTASENQPNASVSPGASTINMRNLGTSRTLVLIDGRRAQPINSALAVDINMIPSALVESVEVISGGAAATYGPDAISGVVNFRLKRDFEGIELNYQTGVTEAGDGEERRADVLIGVGSDRGNAVVGVTWANRRAAWEKNRDFYERGRFDEGTSANYPRISFPQYSPDADNLPSQAAIDAAFPTEPAGSQSQNALIYINQDGSPFRLRNGFGMVGYTGPTTFPYKIRTQTGYIEEVSGQRNWVSTPMTRYSGFGMARYELMENVSAFVQGTAVTSTVDSVQYPFPPFNAYTPRQPGLESPELAALLDSRADPDAPWRVQRVTYYNGNRGNTNETKLYEFTAGLEGELPNSDWTWELYTTYGETTLNTLMHNQLWFDNFVELVGQPGFGANYDVFPFGSGNKSYHCTSGLPLLEPWQLDRNGDLDYLNGFEVTQDCLDAIAPEKEMRNVVTQRISELNVQGRLADMPAGELRGAFGLSQRENFSLYEPDPLWERGVGAEGTTDVTEIYGEILVPLLDALELELGARYSEFETGGFSQDANTYKALFSWSPMETVRLRGGVQRANRTPNVAELYTTGTRQAFTWLPGEPCQSDTIFEWGNNPANPNRAQVQDLCRQLIYASGAVPGNNLFDVDPLNFTLGGAANVYYQELAGNPELKPEIADTYTMGVVWQGSERNLSVALDWYQIDIEETIDNLSGMVAYEQCFNYNGTSNPGYDVTDYCAAIQRDPDTGLALSVEAGAFNLGTRSTAGVDLEVNWVKPLDNGADFGIRSSLNKLLFWKSLEVPGSPEIDYAGTTAEGGLYDYTTYTTFSYRADRWSVALNWRHLSSIEHEQFATDPDTNVLGMSSYDLFNVNGTWRFNDRLELIAGIDNLLDEEPLIFGAQPGVNNRVGYTMAGRYDPLGRRYFVSANLDF